MYGQDTYYLPRTILERDYILNEEVESQFDDAYTVEMYIENTEGFGGDGDLMSKFGLEIRDTATFIVSKRRWEKTVGFWNGPETPMRPLEGDVIYLPLSKSFFQIDKVEHEQPFYQLNNLPTYKLQCSLFEISEETFDTGIAEVDSVEVAKYHNTFLINHLSSVDIKVGESMEQPISAGGSIRGEVFSVNKVSSTSAEVGVINITTSDGTYAEFIVDQDVTFTSGITGTLSIVRVDEGNDGEELYDGFAQNTNIEKTALTILDFSESNPFGEPNGG